MPECFDAHMVECDECINLGSILSAWDYNNQAQTNGLALSATRTQNSCVHFLLLFINFLITAVYITVTCLF